jgi:hypothetical protein
MWRLLSEMHVRGRWKRRQVPCLYCASMPLICKSTGACRKLTTMRGALQRSTGPCCDLFELHCALHMHCRSKTPLPHLLMDLPHLLMDLQPHSAWPMYWQQVALSPFLP